MNREAPTPLHLLKQLRGTTCPVTILYRSHLEYKARSRRRACVSVSLQGRLKLGEVPSLELYSFIFHVTCFLKAFDLMKKLHAKKASKFYQD